MPQFIAKKDDTISYCHADENYLNTHFDKHLPVDDNLILVLDADGNMIDFSDVDEATANANYTHWRWHNPRTQTVFSTREFRNLFGFAKLQAIQTASETDAGVKVFWDDAHLGDVDVTDPDVEAGLSYLVSKELLTEAQKTALLNGESIA